MILELRKWVRRPLGVGSSELDWTVVDWTVVDWTVVDWTVVDWTVVDWNGMDWNGLDWGRNATRKGGGGVFRRIFENL